MLLKGKNVLLGVTGGIAAYKSAMLCSLLVKAGANVDVIMTKNACEFISPLTFETLSVNKVITDTFERNFQWDVKHISLAKKADIAIVAPATANIIAKLATGIADDMLSTTLLACKCEKLVATAMNTAMFESPITQRNISTLEEIGVSFIHGASGMLACNDVGKGRMAEPAEIAEEAYRLIAYKKDLSGVNILVSAGATKESLDPVRFITNHSTGTMGYALARAAVHRGANVILVSGESALTPPNRAHYIRAVSAHDMHRSIKAEFSNTDMLIMAAAVADYTIKDPAPNKLKKGEGNMLLELSRTVDILSEMGSSKKPHQIVCGFSMETENLEENSRKKLKTKNADIIVANNLSDEGAGFGTSTNIITLISADATLPLPKMSKDEAAHIILDALLNIKNKGDNNA